MIWLAALGGAGPISSTGSAIATPTINGVKWNLFSGPNGATTVYSFVAQSQVTSFSGDLLLFFTYLESNNAYSSSQYITTLEAGTEPFTGSSAVLSVSAYSVSIATGAVTSSTKTSTTSTKVSASTTKISTTTSSAATSTGGTIPKYYQCGGTGWTGSGTCVAGTTCTCKPTIPLNLWAMICASSRNMLWSCSPSGFLLGVLINSQAMSRSFNFKTPAQKSLLTCSRFECLLLTVLVSEIECGGKRGCRTFWDRLRSEGSCVYFLPVQVRTYILRNVESLNTTTLRNERGEG